MIGRAINTRPDQLGRDWILVYASYQLVRALVHHGLADALRLVVFPIIAGTGERLFSTLTATAQPTGRHRTAAHETVVYDRPR